MSEVQSVTVHLGPDQITIGYFVVEGDQLLMTFPDGKPVDEQFRVTLRPGDNARAIAGVLTKKVRLTLKGVTEKQDAFFSRRLDYGAADQA